MRTLEELLELLNPGKVANKWSYVPVKVESSLEDYYTLAELFYDENGQFRGGYLDKEPMGNDLEDLRSSLLLKVKGCSNPEITFQELQLIRGELSPELTPEQ